MSKITFETDSDGAFDVVMHETAKTLCRDAAQKCLTIEKLCHELGLTYSRASRLLRAFGLRDMFRKWERQS